MSVPLKFVLLDPNARLPTRANRADAGLDLYTPQSFTLHPGVVAKIGLAIAWEAPDGWAAQIVGRSGLAAAGVMVLGGLIDSRYRGAWAVVLHNAGPEAIEFNVGDRIAQFVLLPVPEVALYEVRELAGTERGNGGFGSTGR